jgi:hypothetical protein
MLHTWRKPGQSKVCFQSDLQSKDSRSHTATSQVLNYWHGVAVYYWPSQVAGMAQVGPRAITFKYSDKSAAPKQWERAQLWTNVSRVRRYVKLRGKGCHWGKAESSHRGHRTLP